MDYLYPLIELRQRKCDLDEAVLEQINYLIGVSNIDFDSGKEINIELAGKLSFLDAWLTQNRRRPTKEALLDLVKFVDSGYEYHDNAIDHALKTNDADIRRLAVEVLALTIQWSTPCP